MGLHAYDSVRTTGPPLRGRDWSRDWLRYMVFLAPSRRQPNFADSCQDGHMPMRTDCKNYESRTYASGETVRKCNLDLAPEAPWRCPENCHAFAPRMADVNWKHGDLIAPPTPPEPPGLGEHTARLLDEAEDIVNSAVPQVMAEMGEGRHRPQPWWRRLRRR